MLAVFHWSLDRDKGINTTSAALTSQSFTFKCTAKEGEDTRHRQRRDVEDGRGEDVVGQLAPLDKASRRSSGRLIFSWDSSVSIAEVALGTPLFSSASRGQRWGLARVAVLCPRFPPVVTGEPCKTPQEQMDPGKKSYTNCNLPTFLCL